MTPFTSDEVEMTINALRAQETEPGVADVIRKLGQIKAQPA